MISRLLHIAFLLLRPMTLGVRGMLVSSDEKILLVRHSYHPGWHLPGGGVERGETLVGALKKEILQEVGRNIIGEPSLHGVFFNKSVSKRDHVAVFVCRTFEDVQNNKTSWEIAESAFFSINALPPDTDPGTKSRIAEVLRKQEISEDW